MVPPLSSSLFCEHKRLKTSCPTCKATAVPAPPREAMPYTSRDEMGDEPTRESKPRRAHATPQSAADLARRQKRQRAPTREEAESAAAWWVKK